MKKKTNYKINENKNCVIKGYKCDKNFNMTSTILYLQIISDKCFFYSASYST